MTSRKKITQRRRQYHHNDNNTLEYCNYYFIFRARDERVFNRYYVYYTKARRVVQLTISRVVTILRILSALYVVNEPTTNDDGDAKV